MSYPLVARLQPVVIPGQEHPSFIEVYDRPHGQSPRLRFAVGHAGFVFDLPASEVRRLASAARDWLKEQGEEA